MMRPFDEKDLITLLEIMQQMKDAAIARRWQELLHLDSFRREYLKGENSQDLTQLDHDRSNPVDRLMSSSHSLEKSEPSTISDRDSLVAEIISLDKEIICIVQAARQSLLDENRGFSARQKAKGEYALTSLMTA